MQWVGVPCDKWGDVATHRHIPRVMNTFYVFAYCKGPTSQSGSLVLPPSLHDIMHYNQVPSLAILWLIDARQSLSSAGICHALGLCGHTLHKVIHNAILVAVFSGHYKQPLVASCGAP